MTRVRLGSVAVVLSLATIMATAANRTILHATLPLHVTVIADVIAALALIGGAWLMVSRHARGKAHVLWTFAEIAGIFLALIGVIGAVLSAGLLYGVLAASAVLPPGGLSRYEAAYSVSPFHTFLLLVGVPLIVGVVGVFVGVLGVRRSSA